MNLGKVLRACGRKLRQCGCMKRFGVAATQSHSANPLGIKRLPAHGNLRLLRVIPAVSRGDKRLKPYRENCGSVVAVPFLAFSKVNLEAVEAGEIPSGTGERHPHFLVHSPDIPIYLEALPIWTYRVKRVTNRVTIDPDSLSVILTADSK